MVRICLENSIFIKKYCRRFREANSVLDYVSRGLCPIPLKDLIEIGVNIFGHTAANISALTSSGFSFANSRRISFDRSSCTFGTTIFTSTI